MAIHIHIHTADAVFDPSAKRNLLTEGPRETAARAAYASQKPTVQKLDVFLKFAETGKEYKETLKLGPRDNAEEFAKSFYQRMNTNNPGKFSSFRFVLK